VEWERVGTVFPHLFALVALLEDLYFNFNLYVQRLEQHNE